MTNTLINIGGSSGVGKTTLSTFLSFIFTDALHLSGDDLHKWERHDDNWKSKTHLNPSATTTSYFQCYYECIQTNINTAKLLKCNAHDGNTRSKQY